VPLPRGDLAAGEVLGAICVADGPSAARFVPGYEIRTQNNGSRTFALSHS